MTKKNKKGKTINVLITIDGETLYNLLRNGALLPGTVSSPTKLGSYESSKVYISMVTQNNNVNNNSQGQSKLTITCASGDVIQWSIITIDANTDQTAYLYDASFKTIDYINPLSTSILGISNPLKYKTISKVNYLPPVSNPTSTPTKVDNTIATASGSIITKVSQTLQYTPCFALVNNSKNTIIGYFSWDSHIVINPNTKK